MAMTLTWFQYKGDEIAYCFEREKWISLGFSGDGSFGDVTFQSLKELDDMWGEFFGNDGTTFKRSDDVVMLRCADHE